MHIKDLYPKKIAVFGVGFKPTPNEVGSLYKSGLLPPECSYATTMSTFKIDGGTDEHIIEQAEFFLTSDGQGLGLDRNDYVLTLIEQGSKKFVFAWGWP